MVYAVIVVLLLCILIGLLIWGKIERHWVSVAIALILIASGAVTPSDVIAFVDWDVLGLILGMSILTVYLELSGFAALAARYIARSARSSPWLLLFTISLVAGLISIFVENVSVVLIMFPVVLTLCRSLGVDPVVPTIMLTLSANIAGSATMVGDPPALLTAGAFNLAFTDFIIYKGKPSMFFFTLVSMTATIAVSSSIFAKKFSFSRELDSQSKISSTDIDLPFLLETVVFLAIKITLLSLRNALHIPLSLSAAVAVGGITIARLLHKDVDSVRYALVQGFEWKLLLFLFGVFTLSGAFAKHGVAHMFAESLAHALRDDPRVLVSALLWLSVAFSAVIDNVPYTLTMIPVVKSLAEITLLDPVTVMWAVLIGTTLGGNLTYIGASANVTAVRLLEKNGYDVSFTEFIKIGLVYNTVSTVLAWILYMYIYF